jgi:hypothetical protein
MSDELKSALKSGINEILLSIVFLIVSTSALLYSLHNGISDLQVISFIGFKISIYTTVGSIFVKFLNGIGFDINKEIFEEHNNAAAIVVGLFWVGLAIAVAAGNLG